MLKRTPLFEIHRSLKAKMVPFSGFEMPLQYTGIREEHIAVRNAAGLFDVSHMGEIIIHGTRALEVIEELSVNDTTRLKPGKAQYTVMCRDDGGIVDDLLIYCLSDLEFMLVVNAANIEKDYQWIHEVNGGRADISNISDEIVLIALQGPRSDKVLGKLTSDQPENIPAFEFRSMKVSDYENILVSATGYTGERGYELYCNIRHVNVCDLFRNILTAGSSEGIRPAGLGARDTLRLEAGFLLYGEDMNETVNPLEAGLQWLVKWDKTLFRGRKALLGHKEQGPSRLLRGLIMKDSKRIPRAGCKVYHPDGTPLGTVTSGGWSVAERRGIALAMLKTEALQTGDRVLVRIRNMDFDAELVRPPFSKK